MPLIHKHLSINKWQKMSLAQQIGNIGSEISRARHWEEMSDFDSREKALERALELVDLTLAGQRQWSRLKELTRLRELICNLIVKSDIYNLSLTDLENFCLNFALIAGRP